MDLALNNLQRLICHKTQPTYEVSSAVYTVISSTGDRTRDHRAQLI